MGNPAWHAVRPIQSSMIDQLLCILPGHARTRIAGAVAADGALRSQSLQPSRVIDNAQAGAVESAISAALQGLDAARSGIVYCPVGQSAAARITPLLTRPGLPRLIQLGTTSGPSTEVIPQATAAKGVGVDRLLVALAAHRYSRQACLVVDAGAVINIDYIDAYGVLQGGVQAPGVSAMLRAYAEATGTGAIDASTVGKGGPDAALAQSPAAGVLLGCTTAARGFVRLQLERVAEQVGVYPRLVATGDDAVLLFEHDDVVENIVPDLGMLGMLESFRILTGLATQEERLAPSPIDAENEGEEQDD